ncbi:hypothetical protein [Asticcacaulis sp.]|uniref:hypothetical protein n=1 Tax=Asticcacaulis sp. TaxID=1872648 RepID=UPI003F7C2CFD
MSAKYLLPTCLAMLVLTAALPPTAALAQAAPVTPLLVSPPDADTPTPLAPDELDGISAEGAVTNVITNQDLSATNSGNTIVAGTVQNGDINFSGNALTGFSGVGNFVTNTGNNNNLQGSISVVVTGAPLP